MKQLIKSTLYGATWFMLLVLTVLFIGQESQTAYQMWIHFNVPKENLPLAGYATLTLLILLTLYIRHKNILKKLRK